jgi:REP element-mobilizing transposase RayT
LNTAFWAFIGGIARGHALTALQVGGIENHVHALVTAPPTIAPAQIAQYLKGTATNDICRDDSAIACATKDYLEGSVSVALKPRLKSCRRYAPKNHSDY